MSIPRLARIGLVTAAVSLATSSNVPAQTLRGVVLYNGDDSPVVLASVSLINATGEATSVELTDPDGFL